MIMDSLANPGKYTVEQLENNADNAVYAAIDAADAAAVYVAAVYAAAYYAARAAADACVAYAADAADWVEEYFTRSGENKQDYIDEINKD